MANVIKISKKMLILGIISFILISGTNGDPAELPTIFKQDSPKQTPAEGSSGSGSHTTYVNNIMEESNVYCIAYQCNKSDFAKYEDIPIEYLIRNTGKSPVKFEKLSIQLPDDLSIDNTTISSNLDLELTENDNNTLIFKDKVGGYSAIKSDPVFIDFMIYANAIGKYIIKPAIFVYSINGIDHSIESDTIHITVTNSKPIIANILLKENPGILGEDNLFSAEIEHDDIRDGITCTLWSSLNGRLDKGNYVLNKISENKYNYSCNLYNLKEGEHIITLKVYDKDKEWVEDEIEHEVIKYYNIPGYGNISGISLHDWGMWVFSCIIMTIALIGLFGRSTSKLNKGKPDFRITVKPEEGSINPGSEVQILVKAEGIGNFDKHIKIEITTSMPDKIKIKQSTIGGLIPTFESIVSVKAEASTPLGKYLLVIKGKEIGNNKEHSCGYILTIF